jgi:hypothetical protein
MMTDMRMALIIPLLVLIGMPASGGTVALWLFDEPLGAYPSSILNDAAGDHILALGRGGCIVEGRFGRALDACDPPPLKMVAAGAGDEESSGSILFGIRKLAIPEGRTVQPLYWGNATFAALATSGERHLRSPGFPNVSRSKLNLGAGDWTLEFWYLPQRTAAEEGAVYEIGSGPRGENQQITRLALAPNAGSFLLYHHSASPSLLIPTNPAALRPGTGKWVHLAFCFFSASGRLRHFVDGVEQRPSPAIRMGALETGEEAYLTVGRDARFGRPLPGRIDELRISDSAIYRANFTPPGSFSMTYSGRLPKVELQAGPPLLFGRNAPAGPVRLGGRKHLFIDNALIADSSGIAFVPNPPARQEKVFDNLRGHMSMVEDETGLIRIYYRARNDWLGVVTSRDGVKWEYPALGTQHEGLGNITLAETVGLGNVFLDPNAPPDQRWKYFSGIKRRSMFVYTSTDGWSFRRHETAALPFAGGSQSIVYYDDQRQLYVGHHRSDYGLTSGGKTNRRFLLSETRDLLLPWSYTPATPETTAEAAKKERIKADRLDPNFLDNGPLSPAGLGIELPVVLAADEKLDPPDTDIYTTKVVKYPWAPDTYIAFPAVYFHYEGAQPHTRSTLGSPLRRRGSGVVEVQLAVSRDGLNWTRYPRPAYVPINSNGADDIHMMFMTHGLVRRGNEIWQYAGGHAGNGTNYHSAWEKRDRSELWRFVQRLDGFVAAEAAYAGGTMTTRPLVFEGTRLRLNIDTGATGYAQVGFLDELGRPIPGYSADECVYINGDFLDTPVEWLGKGQDVSALAGRTVQLVFRMRGARLFAMQFTGNQTQ